MIFIVAKFEVRSEHSDNWLEHVRGFTDSTRAEPGNLWFEWSRSLEKPNEFVLIEAFRDGDAGAAHVQSDHFKLATTETPALLVATPKVIHVEVPGTDWFDLSEMAVPEGGAAG